MLVTERPLANHAAMELWQIFTPWKGDQKQNTGDGKEHRMASESYHRGTQTETAEPGTEEDLVTSSDTYQGLAESMYCQLGGALEVWRSRFHRTGC